MGLASSYHVLADALADLEARDVDVTGVTQERDDDGLSVTIDVRIPSDADGNCRTTAAEEAAEPAAIGRSNVPRSSGGSDEPQPSEPSPRGLVGVVVDHERDETIAERTAESGESGGAAESGAPGDAGSAPEASTDGGSVLDRIDAEDSSIPDGSIGSGGENVPARASGRPESTGAPVGPSLPDSSADDPDGPIPCRNEGCEATFETEHGMKIHHSKVHRGGGDGETPPYEDPDALREVYERHETFAAMTEALEVDVTPNTVRRYMIDHGIHSPDGRAAEGEDTDAAADREFSSREANRDEGETETDGSERTPESTGGETGDARSGRESEAAVDAETVETAPAPHEPDTDGSDDTGTRTDETENGIGTDEENRPDGEEEDSVPEYPVPDGVDLPRNVTLEDVATAVASSSTVYEVGRELRVSRERAQRLLRELDLLDLVSRRLSDRAGDGELRTEIDARLRGAAETSSA